MGYRLGIYKTETVFYGTKLYGYVDSIEDFKSYKFLIDKGYLDYFNNGCENQVLMYGKDLKKFIKLYNDDLNNYARYLKYEKDYFINQTKIKELLDNAEDYDYYVIDWS